MDIKLNENERLDDLEYKGLKIIQNKNFFCFGIDSVLLSDFAKNIKKNATVVDMGTGTGIIGLLMCKKTELSKMIGVEIQEECAEIANRNIILNNLSEKFAIINENIKDLEKYIEKHSVDVVVMNPPYKEKNTGIVNMSKNKLISRHEITASLEEFIRVSSELLNSKGELYMVHRPERLVDIIDLLRKYRVEPKSIRFVQANSRKEPKLVLIKAVKDGKSFLCVEKVLNIYELDGKYTEEVIRIYNKN